jgi:hypothetical protein
MEAIPVRLLFVDYYDKHHPMGDFISEHLHLHHWWIKYTLKQNIEEKYRRKINTQRQEQQ